MVAIKERIKIVIQISSCCAKSLKSKSRWRLLGFCLVFLEEIMVQENLIELEKTMA